MTKQGQWSPSGVWRWREVKLVDSVRAHVFPRFSFVYARATKRLSLSPRVSNTRTCEWHSTTRARDQANDHNKINGVFSPLKSPSFPSINHKFTPVLIFYFMPLPPFVPLLTRRSLSTPLSPCCISVRWHLNKSSPDITQKALKSSFPPTYWLKAHVNKWCLTGTVHLLFSYSS